MAGFALGVAGVEGADAGALAAVVPVAAGAEAEVVLPRESFR
ncbi:MAG: hypothetical protein WCQ11_03610 [Actinomycetes bacterium]